MSTTPPTRLRTMSAMRRPPSTASSTTSSSRSRHSMGGPGSEQTTPRSSVASRSSIHESLTSPPLSASSAQGTAKASPLARGATARAAVPPPPSRGGSANGIKRGSPVPDRSASPAMSEALEGALRREVEEKEELMARLLSRDETIVELQRQIAEMQTTMGMGEGQLAELYADQERWETERAKLEEDIAKKNNVIDKLRIQLREVEKENRDSTRRLTEQAAQFESERQAFYDNTAHLKSRIQSLTDAQKDWKQAQLEASPEPNAEQVQGSEQEQGSGQQQERKVKPRASLGRSEPDEPPEMTALRLELSTLGTSHGSLGQTVKMLQSQLAEMERVNAELQEENEAFTTLLREKTLSGQIDIMRHGPNEHDDEEEQESTTGGLESELAESERQASSSPVESRRVVSHTYSLKRAPSPARSGRSARSARRVAAETLADLPVAGPGLDLAAELGRAENWDGGVDVNEEEKEKEREKEKEQEEAKAKASNAELEALRAEGGRRLDNQEDEEDRIERERMDAHMKLMGIDKQQTVHTPGAVSTFAASMSRETSSGADTPGSRMSGGLSRPDSAGAGVRFPTEELRAEHMELEDEAQMVTAAENRLAALDMREKALSAEMAKGRGGGFTEPTGRGTRVRRRSSGSAASTLFSAGHLSRGGSEADIGEDAEETV
ncbi:hypothetical protein FS749_000292 [Ceratobasidium sp. UAMH 11750]|nr:hypothetical protein FS749_000292 [Ceratobasidium sp. UAMH 11750]